MLATALGAGGLALAVVASLVALYYAMAAARGVAVSAPNQLREGMEDLQGRVVAAQRDLASAKLNQDARLDSMEAKLTTWRTDIEGLLEAVEDTLERTERKRRSAAASASRMKQAEQQGPDPNTREGLREIARARGINVM